MTEREARSLFERRLAVIEGCAQVIALDDRNSVESRAKGRTIQRESQALRDEFKLMFEPQLMKGGT